MPTPLYVIPDIHGHRDKLDHALELIHAEAGAEARIVFLGDYVDRGPDSAGVIACLLNGLNAGHPWTLLRGNHDQMMIDALTALRQIPPPSPAEIRWLSYSSGAEETLASYGVCPEDDASTILSAIPAAHQTLLAQTQLIHQTDDLLLVHAGIRPDVAVRDQSSKDLMWMREPFLSDRRDHGHLVVHGHSPVDWPTHCGNRVALDGGAGWGRPLHVAVFERRDAWLLDGLGRQPLLPV